MPNPPSTPKIFLFHILTLGIYFLAWSYRLGKELSTALQQKAVPSMWWFLLPGGSYYWIWRLSESLELATGKRMSKVNTFLLYVALVCIPLSILLSIPDFDGNKDLESGTLSLILIIVAVVVGISLVAIILAHATFCAIVQGKLNKIRSSQK